MDRLSNIRTGAATSSGIYSLTTYGRNLKTGVNKGLTIGGSFFTYLEECRYEISHLQSIEAQVDTFSMDWGKLGELYVHSKMLGMEYVFHPHTTYKHPRILRWVGSPDGSKFTKLLGKELLDTITDIKCPTSKKEFSGLVDGMYFFDGNGGVKLRELTNLVISKVVKHFREKSKSGEKYYWQLISNACIRGAKYVELIVFMPHKERVIEIIKFNDHLPQSFYGVSMANERKIPFLLKESGYQEITTIRFEVPIEDKKFLEKRVKLFDSAVELDSDKYEDFIAFCKASQYNEEKLYQYFKN